MAQNGHLDNETMYELLDGRLDAIQERRAEAHLLRCESCHRLRQESEALLSSLHWYGADPPSAPEGYWDRFWDRWPVVSVATARSRTRWWAPITAAAASIALLLGIIGDVGRSPAPVETIAVQQAIPTTAVWADDYEHFERATIAIGSVDPLSKGVILASFAEAP